MLQSAKHDLQRTHIKQNALKRAQEAIGNMRVLETTLLTRFISQKVLVAPLRQYENDKKKFECDFKHAKVQDCPRMQTCATSRFVLYYSGAQKDGVVTLMGMPRTFKSWAELVGVCDGVDGIINTDMLQSRSGGFGEKEVMTYLYGADFVAQGYHAAKVEATIYPWTITDTTQPATVDLHYKRLQNCCFALRQTYADVGYADLLSMELPDHW